jgi:Protein of unknown function (DUF2939)
MNRVGYLVSGACALLVTYAVAAPYIVVYQIRDAVQAHDGEELSEHVDFDSLRQGFKDQLFAQFVKQTKSEHHSDDGYAALGTALVGVMVDKAVDLYATPAALSSMLEGDIPLPSAKVTSSTTPIRKPFADASMSYSSFSKFVVRSNNDNGDEVSFIFRRRGVDWKLCDILLPLDTATANKSLKRRRVR